MRKVGTHYTIFGYRHRFAKIAREPKGVKPPGDSPVATWKRSMLHVQSENCPTYELEILSSLNSIPKELGKHQMRASEIKNIIIHSKIVRVDKRNKT